jgi:hypothetical protein
LQQARAACRAVRQYGGKTRICRPRAHLLTGRLALLNGHRRQAVRQFQRGLTEARGLGMPLEQAMCHLALAEAVGDDAERRHHADKGTARMRDLGADPWAGDTGPEGYVADGIAHEQAAYV